jgi:hypothetical protein
MQAQHQYDEQESEVSENDNEYLHHVQLMRSSIEGLKTQ